MFVTGCDVVASQSVETPTAKVSLPLFTPTKLAVSATPKPPAASPTKGVTEPAITISSPKSGETVRSPLVVSGTARVFEGALVIVVKDAGGKVLATRPAQATIGAPERGTYKVEVTFAVSTTQAGTVEAFTHSPKDGSIQDLASVKVTLAPK